MFVNSKFRFYDETKEIIVREIVIRMVGIGGFKYDHPLEESKKERHRVVCRRNLLVAKFLDETSIPMVNGDLDKSKVQQVDVQPIPIDVVRLVACGNGTKPGSCYYSVRSVRITTVVLTGYRIQRVTVGLSYKIWIRIHGNRDPISDGI